MMNYWRVAVICSSIGLIACASVNIDESQLPSAVDGGNNIPKQSGGDGDGGDGGSAAISEDAQYWRTLGLNRLKKTLSTNDGSLEKLKAKNVIIFIGDGMGMTTVTAGRIHKGQLKGKKGEEESLVFDDFPHTGMAKTYNVDKQVPDSAGTATAIFTGIKTLYGVIGMDATTTETNATQGRLSSIMEWAANAGKRIGIVTTTRITHATPASTYARIHDRDWECDTEIPSDLRGIYKDIAQQLVEDSPGNRFNVILGGGLSPMGSLDVAEKSTIQFSGNTEKICSRGDGRNLTEEWLQLSPNRTFVRTRDQLMAIDGSKTDHLLGLFRNNHITYSIARQDGEPSLREMTEQAIKVLDRPDGNGFVLMVEGGRIDQAHHQNYARAAMREVVEMDEAVEAAVNRTNKADTLIIVTADHSHAMTLNGYPLRGTDILGFANKTEKIVPYETLTYANGPGFLDHRDFTNASSTWSAVHTLGANRLSPTYRHLAAFQLKDETHGGEDVAVFASGPGSSLVRGVFEQNYLAYVMSYAGCFGPAKNVDNVCLRLERNEFSISKPSSAVSVRGLSLVHASLMFALSFYLL